MRIGWMLLIIGTLSLMVGAVAGYVYRCDIERRNAQGKGCRPKKEEHDA